MSSRPGWRPSGPGRLRRPVTGPRRWMRCSGTTRGDRRHSAARCRAAGGQDTARVDSQAFPRPPRGSRLACHLAGTRHRLGAADPPAVRAGQCPGPAKTRPRAGPAAGLADRAAGRDLAGTVARQRRGRRRRRLAAAAGEVAARARSAGGTAGRHTMHRTALIVAAKGGTVRSVTAGDVLELLDAEAGARAGSAGNTTVFYRLLHQMGIFGDQAPARLREFRTPGQLSPEELIGRYALQCRPVRDLLVDYLRERQAVLDYASLNNLSHFLGRCFWQDLERHHPGICSLRLPAEVAAAWKQRLRTRPQAATASTGEKTVI